MNTSLLVISAGSLLCLWWAVTAASLAWASRPGEGSGRLVDRWDGLSRTAALGHTVPVCSVAVTWAAVPAVLWYLLTVLTAVAVAAAVLRLPELPARGGDAGARARRIAALGNTAVAAVIIGALLLLLP